MKTTNQTLLPAIQQGTANGNYDGTSLVFNSDASKGAGYYSRYARFMTASWHLTDFLGSVYIEATLNDDPETGEYFQITDTLLGTTLEPLTEDASTNVEGKYTWVRTSVQDFTAGSITKIAISY